MKYIPFEKYEKLVRRLRKMLRQKGPGAGDQGPGKSTRRRDALAVVLGLHGLRVEEVCRLTVGDLDLADGSLRVATLKRGKVRTIRLAAAVVKAIRKLGPGTRDQGPGKDATRPLLATATGKAVRQTQFQRFFRELTSNLFGGDGFRFHACRHTFAMRLYHNTKDIQRVRVRLGQCTVQATQVYVEAYGELDERRMERLGKVEVVPGLGPGTRDRGPGSRKRKRLGGAGDGGKSLNRAVHGRSPVPSTRGAVPRGKNIVKRGENTQKTDLVRANVKSVRANSLKATSEPLRIFRIDEFKSWAEQELAKSAAAMKRSG